MSCQSLYVKYFRFLESILCSVMFTVTICLVFTVVFIFIAIFHFQRPTSNNALTTPSSTLCTHWLSEYKFIYKSRPGERKEDGQLNN